MFKNKPIVIRGGGDIATGTICRLHNCGYKIVVLETTAPTAIRRAVSLSEAVYEGQKTVENTTAQLIDRLEDCGKCWASGWVPLLVDPQATCLPKLQPVALVDAILAKKNCGTTRDMAQITIGLGPGFHAGKDVDAVIETARGHNLGRIIYAGPASPNSGIPGEIGGYSTQRVIYAPCGGTIQVLHDIGSRVKKGESLAQLGSNDIVATISGWLHGMIRPQTKVKKGLKICDIDPRLQEQENCFTISDKARSISGGVLEALLFLSNRSD